MRLKGGNVSKAEAGVFLSGGMAVLMLIFLLMFAMESNDLRDELDQLKRQRRLCPMCEGRGIVVLPEVE
jgi:hypothetical protein